MCQPCVSTQLVIRNSKMGLTRNRENREEDGREVQDLVEVSTRLDYTYDVDKIHNSREPWITAYIFIRYRP